METPPPRLYKYQPLSTRTLTALKTRTLWFGRPANLNDPFDCAVPLRFADVTLDECARLLESKEGSQWAQVRGDRRYMDSNGRPTEELRASVERSGRSTLQQFVQENYTERGVTCFSETPDNTLLWSHYGQAHRGLCLEFDTSSPWLSKLHKIQYTDDIPELNIVDELIGDTSRMMCTLLTKASCWSYEREWRAIHKHADRLYCYGIEALTGVYLGAALTDAEKDLVGHILHSMPTQLYELSRTPSSFRLKSQPVHYTPFKYSPPEAV